MTNIDTANIFRQPMLSPSSANAPLVRRLELHDNDMPQIKLDIESISAKLNIKESLQNFLVAKNDISTSRRNSTLKSSRNSSVNSDLNITPMKQRDFSTEIKRIQEKVQQKSNLKNLLKPTKDRKMLQQRPKILEKEDSNLKIKSNECMRNHNTVMKKTRSYMEPESEQEKYQSNTTYKWPYQSLYKSNSSCNDKQEEKINNDYFVDKKYRKTNNTEYSAEKKYRTVDQPATTATKPPIQNTGTIKKSLKPNKTPSTNVKEPVIKIEIRTATKGFNSTPNCNKDTLTSRASKKTPFLDKKPPKNEINPKRTNNFRLQTPTKNISRKDDEVIREIRVPKTNIIPKKDSTSVRMANARKTTKMVVAPQKKQVCLVKPSSNQKSCKRLKFTMFVSNYNGNFKVFSHDGKLKRILNPTPIIAENQQPNYKENFTLQTFRVNDDKVILLSNDNKYIVKEYSITQNKIINTNKLEMKNINPRSFEFYNDKAFIMDNMGMYGGNWTMTFSGNKIVEFSNGKICKSYDKSLLNKPGTMLMYDQMIFDGDIMYISLMDGKNFNLINFRLQSYDVGIKQRRWISVFVQSIDKKSQGLKKF